MTLYFSRFFIFLASSLFIFGGENDVNSDIYQEDHSLYFVYFTDKPSPDNFDPQTYFHPKSIERRKKHGIPLHDSQDLPLNSHYVSAVSQLSDSLRYQLRWLNAVSIRAHQDQISKIASLPFVKGIEQFGLHQRRAPIAATNPDFYDSSNPKLDTLLSLTRNLMQLDSLQAYGLTGKGVRMAIFDAGFKETNTHQALAYTRTQGNIIATRNFYEGTNNVYNHSLHGTEVMSCVSGMRNERVLGAGKDVSFILARTEHERKEFPQEEDHWIAAAEWADKLGADIINSSITFTRLRYTYEDMDGTTAPVSRAATIASQKGILVVCSMGNEGDSDWQYMGAPADAPEVLSVAGTMPMLPVRIKFSSIGPNVKGQQKPDLAAPAYVVTPGKKNKYSFNAGTSFASPLIAGFAACLMQQNPKATRQEIIEQLKQIGHYAPYYDYYLGYGVPQAEKLFSDTTQQVSPTFSITTKADTVFMHFDSTVMIKDSILYKSGRPLYYHLADTKGKIIGSSYDLIPNKTKHYFFNKRPELEGILRVWFEGYLYEEELRGRF